MLFDLESLKKQSGLAPDQLTRLEREIHAEFPRDEMMFDLHLMCVLDALQKGWLTPEVALAESSSTVKQAA